MTKQTKKKSNCICDVNPDDCPAIKHDNQSKQSKQAHTPTPKHKRTPGEWVAINEDTAGNGPYSIIPDGPGGTIASVYGDTVCEAQANASFIVRACNSHDALTEALSQLLDRLDHHGSIDPVREEGPILDARQALNQAKKGE